MGHTRIAIIHTNFLHLLDVSVSLPAPIFVWETHWGEKRAPRAALRPLGMYKNDSWSILPDLNNNSFDSSFQQLVVINGMLIAGTAYNLETLDLSTPNLMFRLVHLAVELDLFKPISGEIVAW